MTDAELSISDATLIALLRAYSSMDDHLSHRSNTEREASDRIEELVKEVERRIEPEQVEKLVMLADPIMSELYAVECSYRQEAEAKLAKAVEALEVLIQLAHDCEKELTEDLHHMDFCGESMPLTKARATLAAIKSGVATTPYGLEGESHD